MEEYNHCDSFIHSIMILQLSVVTLVLLIRTVGTVSSQQSMYYFFYQIPAYPRDCKEAVEFCHYHRADGVYLIKPDGYHKPFEVYCDNTLDTGGWTVILRRHDGSVTFQRNWQEYKLGFGFLSQEVWIGHERLSFLTNQNTYELRIDFTFPDGSSCFAMYTFFRISDEFSDYKITSNGMYSGRCDAVNCSTNMEFDTCTCQASCQNPRGCTLSCNHGEACYCPNGFYLQGNNCVRAEDCGCFIGGNVIPEGQSYVSPGCLERCQCNNGQLACDSNYRCSPNAVCETRNNLRQCYCNQGYDGDGVDCSLGCSANKLYGSCTCQTSCQDPQGCLLSCTQGQACYCPSGYYLNGNDCVQPEGCGCSFEGNIIPEGQFGVNTACSSRCLCLNGQLVCDPTYRCSPNAVCEERNNVRQCFCNAGYIGDGVNCREDCSTNMLYGSCTCQTSCQNPQGCVLSCTQGQACYCPSGYYLNGNDCVQPGGCGCFFEGNIIPEGQFGVNTACSSRCLCLNGQLVCDSTYQCSPNAVCEERNNVRQCYCNNGYIGDGVTCREDCSTNMLYGSCTCQTSCQNPQGCVLSCTQGQACYCPSGYYLNGNDCVQSQGCGCFFEGNIIPEGQFGVNTACSSRCLCLNGQLVCDSTYQCSPNAVCEERNNVRQCYCNNGYIGDGVTCREDCSTNMLYGSCTCQTSCQNPQGCVLSCTQGQACYCPSGYYLNGNDCVQSQGCGCFFEGNIIPEGQFGANTACSSRCLCLNGQLVCDSTYRCSPNAVCEERNNLRQCYCNVGYVGDGVNCREECSTNMLYGSCTCQASCQNPQGCDLSCTQGQACYCPSGYYLNGNDCVGAADCGCFVDGNIIPNGGKYVDAVCSQLCNCNNDQLDCNYNYGCSPNAACREENGVRGCYCNEGYEGDGETCTPQAYTDCYDAYQAGERQDGVYTIQPMGWTRPAFTVFCDMTTAGGGWTVFQRRTDHTTDFYRNWNEYKQGFGSRDAGNDFWLGNEQIYYLTNQKEYKLRVDIVSSGGLPRYAEYSSFQIGDESTKYRLSIGSYSGDAGNGLYYNNGGQFSTRDQDNDGCNYHDFAEGHKGGWWYTTVVYSHWCTECYYSYTYCNYFETRSSCNNLGTYSNLNGDYNGGNGKNIFWYYYYYCNLNSAEMKIRPSAV